MIAEEKGPPRESARRTRSLARRLFGRSQVNRRDGSVDRRAGKTVATLTVSRPRKLKRRVAGGGDE